MVVGDRAEQLAAAIAAAFHNVVLAHLAGGSLSGSIDDSIRHAITVGFVSLMIMGFAAKVVPTLNGIEREQVPTLVGPFLLVNLGCFLRVSTQTQHEAHFE